MDHPARDTAIVVTLTTICTLIATAAIEFLKWSLGRPERRAVQRLAEEKAVWDEASQWRVEQARRIEDLSIDVKQLREDLRQFGCLIAADCTDRVTPGA